MSGDGPGEHERLAELLRAAFPRLSRAAGLQVAFGGPVDPRTGLLTITELYGTLTDSLRDLPVRPGEGLGGLVAARGVPTLLTDYFSAGNITHRYDAAVSPELLRSVLAVPVLVQGRVRGVIYAAARNDEAFGDRVVALTEAVAGQLARKVAAGDRAGPAPHGPPAPAGSHGGSTGSVPPDFYAELSSIAAAVTDLDLAQRLQRLCSRLQPSEPARTVDPGPLTARETELLSWVAVGLTNAELAERLGLKPETVKSYLRNAMRKLGVHNRTQAVHTARQAGLLSVHD